MDRVQIQAAVTLRITLNATDCPACGCVFAITDDFERRRREDGRPFYCPSGHSMSYGTNEFEIQKRKTKQAEEKLAQREQRITQLLAENDQVRAEAIAKTKELARATKRIHAGICPHCNRTFPDLQRHMESKHNGPEAAVKQIARAKAAKA